jgi:hypothetical protein
MDRPRSTIRYRPAAAADEPKLVRATPAEFSEACDKQGGKTSAHVRTQQVNGI